MHALLISILQNLNRYILVLERVTLYVRSCSMGCTCFCKIPLKNVCDMKHPCFSLLLIGNPCETKRSDFILEVFHLDFHRVFELGFTPYFFRLRILF